MSASRPNVVFVFADEWRGQATGYVGDPNAHTPHLDCFAQQSLNLTQAVAGCSVCCPYRASLLTGQYPLTHGVFINDVELSPDCQSIARTFGSQGYRTGYIGKWHVYGSPEGRCERRKNYVPRNYQLGFDDWWGFECTHDYNNSHYYHNDDPTKRKWDGYDAFAQSRQAAAYIHEHANDDAPFLLMLSWGPPHFPLHTAPDEYRAMYEDRELTLRPNVPPGYEDSAQEQLRGYYAHIAALDEAWVIVENAVREAGIADNTILIFTADHGDMRQSQGLGTKLFPWEESVRVPFLMRWPEQPSWAGRASEIPIDAPDIMPTLLSLCGLETPSTVEGRDWSPILFGREQPTGEEDAFLIMAAEFTELLDNGMSAYRGLRNRQYTYVRNSEGPWLLYDNQADPYQKNNLINRPEHAAWQASLDRRLQDRLDAMGDPFEDGWTLLKRASLTHYREVNMPRQRVWTDPWQQERGPIGVR